MDDQKQQIVERLTKANNVLVTVSNNPSVDQLAACIGLTLALNKLDKHATAVFSGAVPSTIEFLKPGETLEKNTDSLRDFIISLDKGKADKLRYKVEDRVVRIFITPYKTSISDQDLEFSQGDFNVDVVLALGVHEQKDLDQAITVHGRILHDAAVITVNNQTSGDLGGINWLNTNTSSLSEITTTLVNGLGQNLLDEQISTALLTGIVAETDRFSNQKTTADTMNASAALMAAGANQQLVASKLQEPLVTAAETPLSEEMPVDTATPTDTDKEKLAEVQISEDGTLEIDHEAEGPAKSSQPAPTTDDTTEESEASMPPEPKLPVAPSDAYENPRTLMGVTENTATQPTFTSATVPEAEEKPLVNPLDLPPVENLDSTSHVQNTLQDIEQEVHSTHLTLSPPADDVATQTTDDTDSGDELDLTKLETPEGLSGSDQPADIDAARNAVAEAMSGGGAASPPPITALNAQPMAANLNATPVAEPVSPLIQPLETTSPNPTASQSMTMPLPTPATVTQLEQPNPSAAPPVPPPIIPIQ